MDGFRELSVLLLEIQLLVEQWLLMHLRNLYPVLHLGKNVSAFLCLPLVYFKFSMWTVHYL